MMNNHVVDLNCALVMIHPARSEKHQRTDHKAADYPEAGSSSIYTRVPPSRTHRTHPFFHLAAGRRNHLENYLIA